MEGFVKKEAARLERDRDIVGDCQAAKKGGEIRVEKKTKLCYTTSKRCPLFKKRRVDLGRCEKGVEDQIVGLEGQKGKDVSDSFLCENPCCRLGKNRFFYKSENRCLKSKAA